MRKRSALLVSALGATLSFQAFAQPAADAKKPGAEAKPEAKPAETKPAEAKPAPAAAPPAAAAPAPAPAPAPNGAAAPAPAEAPAPEGEPAPDAAATEAPGAAAQPEAPAPQPGLSPLPVWPEPAEDATALKRQGAERPGAQTIKASDAVFAEDWWTHTRPILEWHGMFRARGELFYKFHLGRRDQPQASLFPRQIDHYYKPIDGASLATARGALACSQEEAGGSDSTYDPQHPYPCDDNTNAGANLRFRLDPEFHVSDNLRVITQIDLLDNLVLGSTPSGYSSRNGTVEERGGYTPLGIFDNDAAAPSSKNSLRDSIVVKRVWAEWVTPVGQLRVGRMPNHWGLGMVWNSGDGPDDDYQSTIDRAQITTGIKSLDLYASVAMDFPNDGPTSDVLGVDRGQPYDIASLDDVNQYTFSIARLKSPELVRASLNRDEVVINAGAQLVYRHQLLATEAPGDCGTNPSPAALDCGLEPDYAVVRRDAHVWMPDVWFKLLYKGFRFEAEVATVQGSIANIKDLPGPYDDENPYKLRSWGLATEIEQKLAEDKLHLGFKFGWASGDADVDSLSPPQVGVQDQHGDHTLSTFHFHPSYALDLILYRNILTRVEGTYYFRPSVKYDFLRDPNGQKIGGGLAAIWSRAVQFMQTPGHDRDLGIELNAQLYYQSKDGSLNDDPDHLGGFFAKLEYGVLFPMAGLGYTPGEAKTITDQAGSSAADTNLAQTLRLFLGVAF
jgi:uncharacterized protein (TIGR04551 family)